MSDDNGKYRASSKETEDRLSIGFLPQELVLVVRALRSRLTPQEIEAARKLADEIVAIDQSYKDTAEIV